MVRMLQFPSQYRRDPCVHLGDNLPTGKAEPRAPRPRPKGTRVGPVLQRRHFLQETATAATVSAQERL